MKVLTRNSPIKSEQRITLISNELTNPSLFNRKMNAEILDSPHKYTPIPIKQTNAKNRAESVSSPVAPVTSSELCKSRASLLARPEKKCSRLRYFSQNFHIPGCARPGGHLRIAARRVSKWGSQLTWEIIFAPRRRARARRLGQAPLPFN